jgi:hypothetical protein
MAERRWFHDLNSWAFFVAALALIVSGLTWSDVNRQLRLYRGQVRAYVQIVDAGLVEPITQASYIKLKLQLKNSGETAATNIAGEMDYRTGSPDFKGDGNSATRKPVAPMGPGLERTIVLTSNRINRREWPAPSPRQSPVYFYGTVWYRDDTTGDQRKEDYCYQLPLTNEAALTATALESCGILQYTSKVNAPE